MDLFDGTIFLLGQVLNIQSARHQILAANIANADTPGYRAVDLVFDEELRNALLASRGTGLVKTHPKHFSQVSSLTSLRGRPAPTGITSMGIDRNTVDIEQEMVKLAENSLMYEATAQMLIKKFRGLKEAIREGR